jgi:hypothetical protein
MRSGGLLMLIILLLHCLEFFPEYISLRITTGKTLLDALNPREDLFSDLADHIPLVFSVDSLTDSSVGVDHELLHKNFLEHVGLHDVGVETRKELRILVVALPGRLIDCFDKVRLQNLVDHVGFGRVIENVFP